MAFDGSASVAEFRRTTDTRRCIAGCGDWCLFLLRRRQPVQYRPFSSPPTPSSFASPPSTASVQTHRPAAFSKAGPPLPSSSSPWKWPTAARCCDTTPSFSGGVLESYKESETSRLHRANWMFRDYEIQPSHNFNLKYCQRIREKISKSKDACVKKGRNFGGQDGRSARLLNHDHWTKWLHSRNPQRKSMKYSRLSLQHAAGTWWKSIGVARHGAIRSHLIFGEEVKIVIPKSEHVDWK